MSQVLRNRASDEDGQERQGLVLSGAYRVLGRIGSGSTADVYEAEHVRLGRIAAVKFLRREATDQRSERFRREARALASLDDPHVVAVFDCGELADGTQYLVMERLRGADLREHLRRSGPMAFERAVEIGIDACRGLSAVHAAGLVHRDVKPANLFLAQTGGRSRCKILDLGVAKLTNSEATQEGVLLGTLRYMAPEQLVDSASVTPQTDIYALGAVLYEALSGRPPHTAADISQLMFEVLNRDVAPLDAIASVPPELAQVVQRALARDPAERYANARALELALEPFRRGSRVCWNDATVSDASSLHSVLRRPRLPRSSGRMSSGFVGLAIGLSIAASAEPVPKTDWRAPSLQATPNRPSGEAPATTATAPVLAPNPALPGPPASVKPARPGLAHARPARVAASAPAPQLDAPIGADRTPFDEPTDPIFGLPLRGESERAGL